MLEFRAALAFMVVLASSPSATVSRADVLTDGPAVAEQPDVHYRIVKVRFVGNHTISSTILKCKWKQGGVLWKWRPEGIQADEEYHRSAAARMRECYIRAGFPNAYVTFESRWNEERRGMIITFRVAEHGMKLAVRSESSPVPV